MRKLKYALLILMFNVVCATFSQATNPLTIQPIRDMQWSPDGNFLAVAQHEGGLVIYDQQLTLLTSIYPQDTISSVSWSPNSQNLAIEHLGQLEILSWDGQSSLTSIQVISSENPISSVVWSPMNDVVATAEIVNIESIIDDLTLAHKDRATYYVATWDIQSGQMIMRTSESFRARVMRFRLNELDEIPYFKPIVWKPNSNTFLLTNIEDMGSHVQGQIVTLDYQTGIIEDVIALPFSPITMALKPNSAILAVTFDLGTEEINVNNYQGIRALHQNGFQVVMSWSPDGRFLLIDRYLIDAINQNNINPDETAIARFSLSTFINAWHPYRPIIALGDLRNNLSNLSIEDATEIEGFTASPIANAGENRIVYISGDLTASVQLDASASVDYDGTITGYEWREGENVLSTDSIASVNLPMGIHDIQLTVTDNDNLTDIDTVQIEAICKTILTTESFADAITALQSQTEYDTVCLESEGEYTLTAPLPSITGNITLIGNGAKIVMTGEGRVFDVGQSGVLHLKDVTISAIQPETTPEPNPDGIMRGGINNAGELILEDVILENNSAVRGGAIYNAGVLTMKGGAIQNNSASEFGGGIYNAGQMDLDGVNIHENDAPEGSGVYQEG